MVIHLPWHVAVFKRATIDAPFEQICAGTVLNAKVVLSAVHCFWNNETNFFHDRSLFVIKTGKAFREFDDGNEATHVQTLAVSSFEHSAYFEYRNGFHDDFFAVVLNEPIEFTADTSPICIDLDFGIGGDRGYVSPDLRGVAGGWGSNKTTGQPNSMLSTIEISAISREKCIKDSSAELLEYLTTDKFCAKTLSPGATLCAHDSGSGLVFPVETNGKIKYYLKGVASIGSTNGTCNSSQYMTFTNIAHLIGRISEISDEIWSNTVGQFTIQAPTNVAVILLRCLFTNIPENDRATLISNALPIMQVRFGQIVENNLAFLYTCRDG